MLENTFCHVPRVGVKTESSLWAAGVHDWNAYLGLVRDDPDTLKTLDVPRMPAPDKLMPALEESRERLERRDGGYFASLLPGGEHWRLFPHFRERTAYLDIETTGLGTPGDHITSIAVYDGKEARTYVHGRNMEDFGPDMREFQAMVTFNGRCFDAPFIERTLGVDLPAAHIDLRNVLRKAGITGGLKKCEKRFGLDRGELDGVDGYWAVLLWKEYRRTGEQGALDTLLAYNIEDVLHLKLLMVKAYNLLLEETPFLETHRLAEPEPGANPVTPDPEVMERIRSRYFAWR